jgi:hypothetical protein
MGIAGCPPYVAPQFPVAGDQPSRASRWAAWHQAMCHALGRVTPLHTMALRSPPQHPPVQTRPARIPGSEHETALRTIPVTALHHMRGAQVDQSSRQRHGCTWSGHRLRGTPTSNFLLHQAASKAVHRVRRLVVHTNSSSSLALPALEVLDVSNCHWLAADWFPESSRARVHTPCTRIIAACSASLRAQSALKDLSFEGNFQVTGYQLAVDAQLRRLTVEHASTEAAFQRPRPEEIDVTSAGTLPLTGCWAVNTAQARCGRSAATAKCRACLRAWHAWRKSTRVAAIC